VYAQYTEYAQNRLSLLLNDDPYIPLTLSAQLSAECQNDASDCPKAAQAVLTRHSVNEILTDLKMPRQIGSPLYGVGAPKPAAQHPCVGNHGPSGCSDKVRSRPLWRENERSRQ
jgi:hypothetical protein